MVDAIKTTIDATGRVVIPKKIREQARLVPGMKLDVHHNDGVIEIEPSPVEVKLVRKGRFLVMVPQGVVPPITDEDVERIRQEIEDERWLASKGSFNERHFSRFASPTLEIVVPSG